MGDSDPRQGATPAPTRVTNRFVSRGRCPTRGPPLTICFVRREETYTYDGIRVPVEIWGAGSRSLVFLPGMGVYPGYYREGLARLSRDLCVYVPDLSFRTHRSLLPDIASYVTFSEAFASRYAPDAPRAGHSFGGMVAMLGTAPAIACSPSVPVAIGWPRMFGRAVALQVAEYLGSEGIAGVRWAWRIMLDYVKTAARSPRALFPAVSSTMRGTHGIRPSAPHSLILLSRRDWLYSSSEYERFLECFDPNSATVRRLRAGHDWPVTQPDLLHTEILGAIEFLERPTAAGAPAEA